MDVLRHSILSTFDRKDRIAFLATLFRLARADEVSVEERDRLNPVAGWMDADPDELAQAMKKADDATTDLAELLAGLRVPSKGLLLFRECCAVGWVDGVISPQEAEFLERLASVLGLSDDAKAVLNSPLACSPEGERRFLLLAGGPHSGA